MLSLGPNLHRKVHFIPEKKEGENTNSVLPTFVFIVLASASERFHGLINLVGNQVKILHFQKIAGLLKTLNCFLKTKPKE